ncbi:ATP phosphoribosyltransferase [Candidatus Micrarchaeota archaeon]|nr:ATP phosphoribosyltransferase [Candidatus Micrarchaeota archaeon]MBU1165590.1 ATP phosphoribosyltransferase [Candidatus Micrarchaeota archaeon]MBU1887401.1 ATP phosphoribosyltransferase [Candidatus Micrarchaeota archaeon]
MIRLAIPNKGRVYSEIIRLLEKIGLEIPENGRKLYANTNNPNIQIVYARAADIPLYVQSGAADLGITGEDMVGESNAQIDVLLKLNFGNCDIVVAAPNNSKIKSPADFKGGLRVATKLSNTAKKYFADKNIYCEIIGLAGATELAPYLGISDLIVDQVSTGTTLMENNLRVIDVISKSKQCIIANKNSTLTNRDEIDAVIISIESVITAEVKRYIMANVTGKTVLDRVIKAMPAMESPTILKLAKPGSYSIHSVVDSVDLIQTISKLKKAGAKDILVMNMSRVIE